MSAERERQVNRIPTNPMPTALQDYIQQEKLLVQKSQMGAGIIPKVQKI